MKMNAVDRGTKRSTAVSISNDLVFLNYPKITIDIYK